jgi:hypothetical protein
MKRFLPFAVLIVFLFTVMGICLGLFLAVSAPFRPGNPLFAAQHFAEEQRARLNFSESGKASYYLTLAERRSVDLVMLSNTNQEPAALQALADAIQHAEQAIAQAPESDRSALFEQMAVVAREGSVALASAHLSQAEIPDAYLALEARLATLQQLFAEDKITARDVFKARIRILLPYVPAETNRGVVASNPADSIDPHLVSFLEGSAGAEHAFFPLVGEHEALSCESCHTNGTFSGTPNQCIACHSQAAPANHFPGDCANCHNSFSWLDVRFEHRFASGRSCASCHLKDKPAKHFNGQCSSCHDTSAWKPARFNHQAAGATDCISCHTKNKPANHFAGQCSTCHTTNAWRPALFDHTGLTDCISCHTKNKPANHFSGQCSACHNTSAWKPATFNHETAGAVDCLACHSKVRPPNHYTGQCSTCHTTNAWKPATFNHQAAGATDCISCHTKNKPANHYSGQCSQCHTTSAWKPANFNHAGLTDCISCHTQNKPANHYSGQCSQCHTTSSWGGATFNHTGQTDCLACHTSDRPANHYSGQCSQCHTTSSWGGATFNHTGQTDCASCHTKDRPSNHWSGQCSQCHNTSSWSGVQVKNHTFPVNHKNAEGVCARCHPSKTADWTCYQCHDRAKTEQKHSEKNIFDIATRCIACHPTGKN